MSKKIKVVHIVEAMLGGIRQHVEDIVTGLDSRKYEIYLIYSDNRADERFFQDIDKLEKCVHLIKCNEMEREISIKKDLAAYRIVKKYIKQIQPDIVHCHSSKAGIIGRLAAKQCGVKKIIYTPNAYAFQNPNVRKKRQFYVVAERMLSRYATTVTINVSEGERQKALENKLDRKEKFTLIYNGIPAEVLPDRNILRKNEGYGEIQILVGVTARCAEQKDPFTFLKIAQKVIGQNKNVEFVYIGDGPMEEAMKEWIREKKLEHKIHMLGFRSNASELVNILDVYLSTALYEGLPYSMIEAMRAGVPIIATNVVGNNELVINGVNGLLFDAGDVDAGAELVIGQIERQMIQRENVVKTYEEKFSLKVMLEKLEKVYQVKNVRVIVPHR